jgi:hypothetical protein
MPKHDVATWSGVVDVVAGCECGWGSRARNALANAKRHAVATGHVVCVLQQLSVTYAPGGMGREEMQPRTAAAYDAQDKA